MSCRLESLWWTGVLLMYLFWPASSGCHSAIPVKKYHKISHVLSIGRPVIFCAQGINDSRKLATFCSNLRAPVRTLVRLCFSRKRHLFPLVWGINHMAKLPACLLGCTYFLPESQIHFFVVARSVFHRYWQGSSSPWSPYQTLISELLCVFQTASSFRRPLKEMRSSLPFLSEEIIHDPYDCHSNVLQLFLHRARFPID